MVKIIKNWFSVCKPSAAKLFFGALFCCLSKFAFVSIGFFVSNIISSVQIAAFNESCILAIKIIIFTFAFAIFETIGFFVALSTEKQVKERLEKALAEKCFSASSPEKEANSITLISSIKELSAFCEHFCTFWGNLFALIFVLVVLCKANVLLFIMALILGTICFLLYGFFSKKLASVTSELSKQSANTQMVFLSMAEGANFAYDYSKEQNLYEKFSQNSHQLSKTHKKAASLNLIINTWILFLWYAGIGLILIYMIKLLKYDYLSLSSFLVCLPYLILLISLFCALAGFFIKTNAAKTEISSLFAFLFDGLNLSFGSNKTDKIKGTLEFINATLTKKEKPLLLGVSFSAKKGQIVVLEFKEKAAYYAFCNLIRRKTNLDKGNINIDDINIKDFEKQTYTNNLSVISSPYYFEDIDILTYLKTSGASQNKIENFLKETGLFYLLKKEKLTLLSGAASILNKDLLYLLYFARAYLEGAEILVFFGVHFFTSPDYKRAFYKLIKKIRRHKTIVVATTFKLDLEVTKYYKIDSLGKIKST